MSGSAPRVAFFPDSFHEVNGVALTCRSLDQFARRKGLPLFSCHAGPETRIFTEGSVTTCELSLSPVGFGLESDLRFDLLFARHRKLVEGALRVFQPGLVHITGPSHTGILGALSAHALNIPIVASWHTNIHEYGRRRLEHLLGFLPPHLSHSAGVGAERHSLNLALRFYSLARRLLAPNEELRRMLEEGTGKPCHLMPRGVDTVMYHPAKRSRRDDAVEIGYVGRLSPEKNVRLLAKVDQALASAGLPAFRIRIVGGGGESEWLRQNLPHGDLPGVLRGEALAEAYAGFDVFAFTSRTDTFGNVIQEAQASGVPCVVTNEGGPRFLVRHGVDGLVADTDGAFVEAVVKLATDAETRRAMGSAAREKALSASWDRVFEGVWDVYRLALAT
jgi:glycosyltransferase involved in cell wall biosynthesis